MSSRFSIEAVFTAVDRMSAPMRRMGLVAGQMMRGPFQRDFSAAQRRMTGFTSVLGGVARVGLGMALAGLIAFGVHGLKLASDLREVQNVVDVTFGQSAGQINSWARRAMRDFGLSELQAKQFTGSLGAMLSSSGITGNALVQMSTDLSGLAGDFASFYNFASAEDAFSAIRSGISGETEPLKRLGINMSVANMQAFALSRGITRAWQSMNQAEQTTLRYQYLMDRARNATGDFARTLDTSMANQVRVLKNQFDSFAAKTMDGVVSAVTRGSASITRFIATIDTDKLAHQITGIVESLVSFIGIVGSVLLFLSPLAPIIISIVGAVLLYRWAMNLAALAQMFFNSALGASPVMIFIIAVAALVGVLYTLWTQWDELTVTARVLFIAVAALLAAFIAYKIVLGVTAILDWIKYLRMMWPVIMQVTSAQWGLNLAMMMNPIGIIIALVIALVVVLVILYNKCDIVRNFFNRMFLELKVGFFTLADIILTVVLAPIQYLLELLARVGGALGFDTSGLTAAANSVGGVRSGVRERSGFGAGGEALGRNMVEGYQLGQRAIQGDRSGSSTQTIRHEVTIQNQSTNPLSFLGNLIGQGSGITLPQTGS